MLRQNDTVDGPAASLMHDGVNSVRSKSGPAGFRYWGDKSYYGWVICLKIIIDAFGCKSASVR